MAKLPKQRKILPENFPKEKFMPDLLAPINNFFEDVTNALNKGLTFKENIASEVLTVIIDGTFPLNVQWTNRERPIAAWIGNCREISGTHTTITTALYLDWEMRTNDQFRINNVAGLTGASTTNKFRITIIGIIG